MISAARGRPERGAVVGLFAEDIAADREDVEDEDAGAEMDTDADEDSWEPVTGLVITTGAATG